MNDDQITNRYYGKVDSEKTFQKTQYRIHWICKNVKGNKVIDIGSSQGIVSILLGREGFNVTGIDLEENKIKEAQEELSKESEIVKKNIRFINYDSTKLEQKFVDEKFDTAILGEVLEHFSHPEKLLKPIYNILNSKARLVLTVPFGYLRFHDHKQTFYIYTLIRELYPYFETISIEVRDKVIYYIGERREAYLDSIDKLDINKLLDWIKLGEEEFANIEKNLDKLNRDRKKLLDKRNEEIKNLKNYIQNIKNDDLSTSNESKKYIDEEYLMKEIIGLEQKLYKKQLELKVKNDILKNAYNKIKNLSSNTSTRYKLGEALISAIKSPKKAIKLPKTLISIYRKYKKESKNLLEYIELNDVRKVIKPIESSRGGIIFTPTNGAGLGHLTRLLAIARRIKKIDPDREIIFFSTSSAMHLILQEGFLGYHLPSKMLFSEDVTATQWNGLLEEQLSRIIQMHRPSMLVFDGAYPYAGLVSTMTETQNLNKIWIKRGRAKQGLETIRDDKEKFFDHVLKPGEAGMIKKENEFNPVIYLEKTELLSKEEVRKKLQIPKGYKIVYVQLGAGNIDDINSTINKVLKILEQKEDVYIVMGESIIGKRLNIFQDRLLVIRDYPNSRYFKAFDMAISATGYNTFHELMYFGVPSIFIPNTNTKTDDQLARAKKAAMAGAAKVIEEVADQTLTENIDYVLNPSNNLKMKENCKKLIDTNGADEIAEFISKTINDV
ncbi:methyltransferase domain-containing protein [Senegalia massiliensis]|uniref:Methyltransferase domain-containing protein n=1 Tax=Senegalia massiliensis TaxID=1720316 RepID=A0A845R0P1_9CLOT|nr:methyltransferase domain-containing protein [Senegalia massiliensis]